MRTGSAKILDRGSIQDQCLDHQESILAAKLVSTHNIINLFYGVFTSQPQTHFTGPTHTSRSTMSSFIQDADSSCAPLESIATSYIKGKKKGKKTSPIWAYTCKPLLHENQDFLYCFYCILDDLEKKLYGADNSSSIIKHIKAIYPYINLKASVSKN